VKKKILIYDDRPNLRGKVRAQLERVAAVSDAFTIITPDQKRMLQTMSTLEGRRHEFRETGTWEVQVADLDSASIFVVDFDLFEAVPFLDGETVAYLARCFSSCGLIVGYRYGDNSFDLTLRGGLQEELQSFTDLYLGGEQLSNASLWTIVDDDHNGLRPWHWPVLPNYLRDLKKKVHDVKESVADNAPICQVLGLTPDLFEMLPRTTSQFLGRNPSKTSFREFVTQSSSGLEPRDASAVRDDSHELLARVGAARISKWLERLVLPGQDTLVDAPHLVSRYPSLLLGDAEDIRVWNRTGRLTDHEDLGLSSELIAPFRFKESHWLSRPAWLWDALRESESIVEVKQPWLFKKPDWVFCEDTSRFHEGEKCQEFVADLSSPFSRRFAKVVEGVDYRPRVRFSI